MERDDYGLIDSGIPPEIVAKLLGNRERKKVAEAILSQSMKPVENMGGPGAKISWTQGLAQMLDAYQGGKGMRDADASRQAIADEIARGQQASLDRYKRTAGGTPGVVPLTPMDDEGNAMPSSPAVPGNRRQAIVDAFMDPYMKNSPLPKMDLADLNRDEEKKAQQEFLAAQAKQAQTERAFQAEENRKQRMAELEMRLADARLAREDRASLAQQLAEMRAESMRFAASLKQDPNRPRLKPGERYDEATGTVVPIEGSDLYRGQADKHAKDLSAANGVELKTTQALKKIDDIIGPDPSAPKPAEGFSNLFGGYMAYGTRMLPGQTQSVSAKIESLKSDLKAAGLELMRTGGSIGQMTQQEWPIVQDMIARIDPRMPEKDAIAAFQQVRAYMNRIRDNAQGIYKTEWGDSVFTKKKAAGSPAAASPGTVLKFDANGNPVQ